MLPHMKTPSGDTVSVAAAKNHHHYLKAQVYGKQMYTYPNVYSGYPVYNTPVYNTGVYSAYPYTYGYRHHLGKREAEADSQVFYNNAYHGYPHVYNTHAAYTGYTGYPHVYNTHMYNTGAYSAYPYTYGYRHHLGKREAEADADSQVFYKNAHYNILNAQYPQVYNTHMYNTAAYPGYTGYNYSPYHYGNLYNNRVAYYGK